MTEQNERPPFDPGQHLSNIKGQDYLEVKYRLMWLRAEAPESRIETAIHQVSPEIAIVTARVTKVVEGQDAGVACGIGSETPGDFEDFIEKAETKAIGRALGALGYGTQFSFDHADGPEVGMLADSPVNRPGGDGNAPTPIRNNGSQVAPGRHPSGQYNGNGGGDRPRVQNPGAAPSDKQLGMIQGKARERGMTPQQLDQFAYETVGATIENLNKGQASSLIDELGSAPKGSSRPVGGNDRDTGGKREATQNVQDEMSANIQTWLQNIQNARSEGTLGAILGSLTEFGLDSNPQITKAVTAKREELKSSEPLNMVPF